MAAAAFVQRLSVLFVRTSRETADHSRPFSGHCLPVRAPASLPVRAGRANGPERLRLEGRAADEVEKAQRLLRRVDTQLLVTTNWLVVRGTAPYSKNAALLSQYLPGYTVSLPGSIVGSIELFVAAFIVSHLLAGIYNAVARSRMRHATHWESS